MRFAGEVAFLVIVWRCLALSRAPYMAGVYRRPGHWSAGSSAPPTASWVLMPDARAAWQRYATSLSSTRASRSSSCTGSSDSKARCPQPPALRGGGKRTLPQYFDEFVTNTNWQNYTGESTMSVPHPDGGPRRPAVGERRRGLASSRRPIRGFPQGLPTIGNFWVDVIRGVYYVLLPISRSGGDLRGARWGREPGRTGRPLYRPPQHAKACIPLGPQASMTAIKQLGNNGGGYTNANGAHPFENPTAFTQWLSLLLLLAIPVASTYMFGKMVKQLKPGPGCARGHGHPLRAWASFSQYAEAHGDTRWRGGVDRSAPERQHGGQETRFGVAPTTLFDIASTQTSTAR